MATLIKRENGDMHKICLTDAHVNAQNIQEELYTEGQYTKVYNSYINCKRCKTW